MEGTSKTRQCYFTALLYGYLALNGFGFFTEVKACAKTYEEHIKVYLSVNVVKNTVQIHWLNLDYLKYSLVLASISGVNGFLKNEKGDYQYWKNGVQYVYKTINPKTSSGFVQTDGKFDRSKIDQGLTNLGWYVYLTTSTGTAKTMYCMKSFPTWMNDFHAQIGNISLNQLFIPGTHSSASYYTHNSVANIHTKDKYVITQGWEDVESQLRIGARYLDIHVGQYVGDEPFWTVHGTISMHTVRNILGQVRQFVKETNEIVILDIQHFERGFSSLDDHNKFVQLILSEIGNLMVSPSIGWKGTLNQIWATDKRIVVCYENAAAFNPFPDYLWRATRQRSAYVDNKNVLKSYLYNKQSERSETIPTTDIATMMPRTDKIVGDAISSTLITIFTAGIYNPLTNADHSEALFSGLSHRAQEINHDVTLWYFHDLGRTCNIVAVDYILGTNIVEAAIYWNLRKER